MQAFEKSGFSLHEKPNGGEASFAAPAAGSSASLGSSRVLDRAQLFAPEIPTAEVLEFEPEDGERPEEWHSLLSGSRIFRNLPPDSLRGVLHSMTFRRVRAEESVLQQGKAAHSVFVMVEGCATILRERIGELPLGVGGVAAGEFFGEDALLSGSQRQTTVRMLSDGRLMRLPAEKFMAYLVNPLSVTVTQAQADQAVGQGIGRVIDVGLPSRAQARQRAGTMNMPFFTLRARLWNLPRARYFCVGDDALSPRLAALLLREKGYDAVVIA
ncbi:MAG: cyclic nucleotide-binding domain-containing protein [Panacagrimonas sp.]